jgi:beta-N-acetylhexosaminidase
VNRTSASAALVLLVAVALASCTGSPARTITGSPVTATSRTETVPASGTPAITSTGGTSYTVPTTPAPPSPTAQALFARMTEAQRVGQLFMVDCPSTFVRAATLDSIDADAVGSVILDGTSYLTGGTTRQLVAELQRHALPHVGLFVATDQEGGQVQRLRGSSFSEIPSAVAQGTVAPPQLRTQAKTWGIQLRLAGVNVNLAPVLDTVPADWGSNPPIGDLNREYGNTPAAVAAHGVAVAQGFADAGVVATVKHFPGVGRTYGNTDLTGGVQDTVTTRHDPFLAPFRDAINAGVPFVMMSTAVYADIDPTRPAAFSPTIVTGMLRGDLGFHGVIISDDIGIAAQVRSHTLGERAVDFIRAGGDIVLTVDATQAGPMTQAVLARAGSDSAFRAQVDAAALTVLQAKQAAGLLH